MDSNFPSPGMARTSQAAWYSAQEKMPARIKTCYEVAKVAGAKGITADEMEQATGYLHQSIAAPLLSLRRAGLLIERGDGTDTRRTRNGHIARVYVAVPFGQHVPNPNAGDNRWKVACEKAHRLLEEGNRVDARYVLWNALNG